ncbi:MAG: ABC transporter permease [Candidatus Nomurabacteria bacterium]|jgi:putative ABC transport system permease protein|nr:ABC transporter permease [Candidatus Nomurabacteria bacterium]
MTSLSLSFKNVRKSFRDFTVYFVTLMLGVSIFYIFNSIDSQQSIMEITSSQGAALASLNRLMANFSILISIILVFLIIYANRYLIKRRKKEFGVYLILGMSRRRVSQILVLETAFVGLIALVAGSAFGILLSQGMAALTAKLLGAGIVNFQFIFSVSALKKTLLYFGLTFILTMIFNIIMVRRQKLLNLIYASRQNEGFKPPRLALSALIFLLSIGCLAVSYSAILNSGLLSVALIWTSVISGVVGTFLFFFSLSGFFLKLIQRMKKLYFKNMNMFVLRQINSKINTNYISITFVCLMLFISICTLSSGMGLAKAVTDDISRNTPYDATLSIGAQYNCNTNSYNSYPAAGVDLLAEAKKHNVNLDSFAKSYVAVRYYNGEASSLDIKNGAGIDLNNELYYVKLSDYNKVMELQGLAPITLAENSYAVDSTTAYDKWIVMAKDKIIETTLTVGGRKLSASPERISSHSLEVAGNYTLDLLIIVPDELLANAPAKRDLLHIKYLENKALSEDLAVKNLSKITVEGIAERLETKKLVVEDSGSTTTTISYLAVYLGVIFLIASGTVLAIAQLSEANDNVRRYKLLHKIGTDERQINRAVFLQNLIYFGVPLTLALAHSIIGVIVAAQAINSFRGMNILDSSLITALIIVSIYGGYFLITYLGSKNVIIREYSRQEKEG